MQTETTSTASNVLTPDVIERIEKLAEKYASMGQDMRSYLDGLLYSDFLTYWDYIHLDVLLNLQNPKTPIKDELIFIIYHQTTELNFKLMLHAIDQMAHDEPLTAEGFLTQLKRVNSYWKVLIASYEIMVEGMDKEQFLQFRMSLLPASGFQSAQYRMIEICAAPIDQLIGLNKRANVSPDATIAEKYNFLYWKQGATEL